VLKTKASQSGTALRLAFVCTAYCQPTERGLYIAAAKRSNTPPQQRKQQQKRA
jgi:hypothetical protein